MSTRPIRIVINGFGRIGRTILRQLVTSRADLPIELVLINDVAPLETCAYLFEFDSVFGPAPCRVETVDQGLVLDGRVIPFHRQPDLTLLDLSGVDVVLDCTGKADSRGMARRGIVAGARRVLISGPSDAADVTVVPGANDAALGTQELVSAASCTTNAVAPLLAVLEDAFGVTGGHMNTIHCYTGSQPTVDAPRGGEGADLARSRAAALSMVPTTTSATHQIEKVLPGLAGRVTGSAVRVPVASVSAVDMTLRLARPPADVGALRDGLRGLCAASPVLGWTDRPLVSTDLRARPESLILAGPELMLGPDHCRVFGWYDNEWGFSSRMLDLCLRMGAQATES